MDLTSLPLVSTLLDLTHTGLLALIALLTPPTGPLAPALAIALVTLVVRAGLIPAGIAQAKAEQTRAPASSERCRPARQTAWTLGQRLVLRRIYPATS
ncbi:hypothetical protein [Microbacterium sp.]|uniref:hypothetical protein n=1 Tax=Microbacterium sp. TaxID=51671 RepID=UPI00289CA25C|nr:hypothetical protein [Microbacterium sp.]